MKHLQRSAITLSFCFILALISHTALSNTVDETSPIVALCGEIGDKLGSVSTQDCQQQHLSDSGQRSNEGRALAYKEYPPLNNKLPLGRVLLMGGIHGDEYSAISIMFKWIDKLNQYHSGLFHWKVIPLLNPDGLLQTTAQRQNANGVDLNRNFPSQDWQALAQQYWRQRTHKNIRRYPGKTAASEPETQWFIELINTFKPDAIIAVHAPHQLVDFDGPQAPPQNLGSLRLRRLGIYPGSLGNYAGVDLDIPVVTVELASAGIMPSNKEVTKMWVDLVGWLRKELPKRKR